MQTQSINNVIDRVRTHLQEIGYSQSSISKYNQIWIHFEKYFKETNNLVLTENLCCDFLTNICKINQPETKGKALKIRAIKQLLFFEKNEFIPKRMPVKQYIFANELSIPILAYIQFRKTMYTEKTVKNDYLYLEKIGSFFLQMILKI